MEKLVKNCGPMPAFKCTIRCTAKHGLTRISPTVIQVYKVYFEMFQLIWRCP